MNSVDKLKVKVCGITTMEEVKELVKLDIEYLGFIFVKKSKRFIDKDDAKVLIRYIKQNSNIKTVGVFVDSPLENVLEIMNYAELDVIQLHGNEDDEYILNLKDCIKTSIEKKKDFEIWKAVSADSVANYQAENLNRNHYNNQNYNEYLGLSNTADAILLDSGKGGTGKTFDWQKFKDIGLNRRIILAGGISNENVKTACKIIKPEIVDINSRVEDEKTGKKDIQKIKEFLAAVDKYKALIY